MAQKKSLLHTIMGVVRKLMPSDSTDENRRAVAMFRRVLQLQDFIRGTWLSNQIWRWSDSHPWPVTSGSYIIADNHGSVAICTLTSPELMESLSKLRNVAITGRLVTTNLGIEKIILNTISNPRIQFLVICGKESPVFHPAQGLRKLFENGVDSEKRIIDAKGHFPVLKNIQPDQIEAFRQQVKLVDCTDQTKEKEIEETISALQADENNLRSRALIDGAKIMTESDDAFQQLRPGGKRGTPTYDPAGFFVINLDRESQKIILRHYLPDNTPAHKMEGGRAESIMRGLVRAGLISQLDHAGYLGIELAKAETALRLGLPYEQDHPLKRK